VLLVETPDGKEEEIFVVDYHMHIWNAAPDNWLRPDLAKGWINCFYDYTKALSPPEYVWDWDTYVHYGEEKALRDVFQESHVDMAIFEPQTLNYFYKNGFSNVEAIGGWVTKYPDRLLMGSRWDARDGEEGKAKLESQAKKFRHRPFQMRSVKLYTAEWKEENGGMSRGWRLDSKEAYDFLELNRKLGINIQVAHKGPTVWPLDKDAFALGDVDAAATSFPDMKFVITHIGLPRLDDFCWTAVQDKNLYAGMAVAMAFVHNRPRYFAEMMAELLYWLGPDRILYSADYGIWHPKWIIEDFLNFEMPEDLKKEYGVDLTFETKKKILGENAAKLWGIDIEQQKKKLKNDELAKKLRLETGKITIGEKAKAGRPLARKK
jgi:uncharacterized protein